jgi:hypothetical protein
MKARLYRGELHSDHGHRASRAKRGKRGTTPYTDFSKNLHRLQVDNAALSSLASMWQLQRSFFCAQNGASFRQPTIELTATIVNPSLKQNTLRISTSKLVFSQRIFEKNPARESVERTQQKRLNAEDSTHGPFLFVCIFATAVPSLMGMCLVQVSYTTA